MVPAPPYGGGISRNSVSHRRTAHGVITKQAAHSPVREGSGRISTRVRT